ncbi:hypothetical protein GA0074694_3417 [Micromonospora inyonensis]|uniref:Uncharacterized protein n=1 Tax=Micromonospora inyonensis TaxID=47866 RepID=A0A1C6RZI0_9ACTN|nr:hypothetical protein GA0074694_3417 [Micromonospora inyonensis]
MVDLQGWVAIVTGGASGLGQAPRSGWPSSGPVS